MVPLWTASQKYLQRQHVKYIQCKKLQEVSRSLLGINHDEHTGKEFLFCVRIFHMCNIKCDCGNDFCYHNEVPLICNTHSIQMFLLPC
jgi:hypothetical protein